MKKKIGLIKNERGSIAVWFLVIVAVFVPVAYVFLSAESNFSFIVSQARDALDQALLSTKNYTTKQTIIVGDKTVDVCTYDAYSEEKSLGLERYWNKNRYSFFANINGYNKYWYIPEYFGYTTDEGEYEDFGSGFYFNRIDGTISAEVMIVLPAVYTNDFRKTLKGTDWESVPTYKNAFEWGTINGKHNYGVENAEGGIDDSYYRNEQSIYYYTAGTFSIPGGARTWIIKAAISCKEI
jgi:hypothetical protein